MSTHEPSGLEPDPAPGAAAPGGRAARRPRRRPLSLVNTVLVGACLAGAIIALATGNWPLSLALLVAAALALGGALLARRAGAGDLERVNALEYADERDRAAGVKGLAVVGAAALVLAMAQILVTAFIPEADSARQWGLGVLLALGAIWFAANWYFVRRG